MHNIVLIGVGGTGMSAIASLFLQLGYTNVVGIDAQASQLTDKLQQQGMKLVIGHGKYQPHFRDFVIYSDIEAIKQSPEMKQSFSYQDQPDPKWFHKPFSYNEFLAELSKYFVTVAVTGSNGKSSTTAMAIKATSASQNFALGMVGALLPDFDNSNCVCKQENSQQTKTILDRILTGKGEFDFSLVKKFLFIIEACEYKEHFLLLDADYTLITNIDWDHADYFKTSVSYLEAFQKMCKQTRFQVITHDHVSKQLFRADGQDPLIAKAYTGSFDKVFGAHHHQNAALVSSLIELLELPVDTASLLQSFSGLRRRMEPLGQTSTGALLYSDYGHHPPALAAGIQALKVKYPDKHILACFQPHQAQRVLQHRDEFVEVIKAADEAVIYKLYTAREQREDFVEKGQEQTGEVLSSFDHLGQKFAESCGGQYYTDIRSLQDNLQTKGEDTVIVLFTAGDLDYKIRSKIS